MHKGRKEEEEEEGSRLMFQGDSDLTKNRQLRESH